MKVSEADTDSTKKSVLAESDDMDLQTDWFMKKFEQTCVKQTTSLLSHLERKNYLTASLKIELEKAQEELTRLQAQN